MSVDRVVLAVAGLFIIISVILGHYVHPYWLFFTLFVGANLFQSAFTGFCPMAMILKKFGIRPGQAFS